MLSKFAKSTNKETRLKPVGDSCYGPKIYNLKTNPTKPTELTNDLQQLVFQLN